MDAEYRNRDKRKAGFVKLARALKKAEIELPPQGQPDMVLSAARVIKSVSRLDVIDVVLADRS